MLLSTLTESRRIKAMVKKLLTIALTLLLSFFFKGCSVVPKKAQVSCNETNWSMLGQKIARKGGLLKWPPKNLHSCLENKTSHVRWKKSFESGHQKGLTYFCSPKKGFVFGLFGGNYKNHCPKKLAPSFIKEYKKGFKVHQFKKEIVQPAPGWADFRSKSLQF